MSRRLPQCQERTERDSESHEDINMGSSSGKRQPPPGVAVTMSPMQLHFQSLYVDVREALKSAAASPEDASAACLALKHFFREAAKQMVDDLDVAEFLDALEKLLREIDAKLCDERGAEEEGRRMLQAALASMEELRENYLDCKGCTWVIGDTQAGCADKARYPPFQACMKQERERRRALAECGARPHLFDRGFSTGPVRAGDPTLQETKLQELEQCLKGRAALAR
jgi:hypothetical protein